MSTAEIREQLRQAGLFVILRKIPGDKLLPLVESLCLGGLRAIEVTYNTPQAREQLQLLVDQFSSCLLIGAGTIFTREEAREAVSLGAQFLVSPHVSPEMVEEAGRADKVSISGAATATEVHLAHQSGADFIKLFPAGTLGVDYFKQLRGPFDQVSFMAVGGIAEHNIGAFRAAGAEGFGIGSAIVDPKLIEAGRFTEIQERCKRMIEKAKG